jgi:hypothetical protein
MMEKRAFHPLKARRKRPESSKQAEIALAWIATILSIRRFSRPDTFAGSATRIAARV